MSHYHAVVWIDHQKGTVWQFSPTEQEGTVVHAHGQHKVHSRKSTHVGHEPDKNFFDEVAHALADLQAYARRHFAAIDRIFAAETHPGH